MTTPEVARTDRFRRFLAQWSVSHPGRQVMWSDNGDHAVSVRMDDLRAMLAKLEEIGE